MMDDATLLGDLDTLQPVRKAFRNILLPKPLLVDAGRVALHRDRATAQMGEDDGRHRLVVMRQIALCDPVIGKEHFVGVRDHPLMSWTARCFLPCSSAA